MGTTNWTWWIQKKIPKLKIHFQKLKDKKHEVKLKEIVQYVFLNTQQIVFSLLFSMISDNVYLF